MNPGSIIATLDFALGNSVNHQTVRLMSAYATATGPYTITVGGVTYTATDFTSDVEALPVYEDEGGWSDGQIGGFVVGIILIVLLLVLIAVVAMKNKNNPNRVTPVPGVDSKTTSI